MKTSDYKLKTEIFVTFGILKSCGNPEVVNVMLTSTYIFTVISVIPTVQEKMKSRVVGFELSLFGLIYLNTCLKNIYCTIFKYVL